MCHFNINHRFKLFMLLWEPDDPWFCFSRYPVVGVMVHQIWDCLGIQDDSESDDWRRRGLLEDLVRPCMPERQHDRVSRERNQSPRGAYRYSFLRMEEARGKSLQLSSLFKEYFLLILGEFHRLYCVMFTHYSSDNSSQSRSTFLPSFQLHTLSWNFLLLFFELII